MRGNPQRCLNRRLRPHDLTSTGVPSLRPATLFRFWNILQKFAEMAARRATFVRMQELTRRETHVATLLSKGLTNSDIAKKLELAEQTVKNHVHAVYRKLEARNRVQIARAIAALKLAKHSPTPKERAAH